METKRKCIVENIRSGSSLRKIDANDTKKTWKHKRLRKACLINHGAIKGKTKLDVDEGFPKDLNQRKLLCLFFYGAFD